MTWLTIAKSQNSEWYQGEIRLVGRTFTSFSSIVECIVSIFFVKKSAKEFARVVVLGEGG